MPNKRVKWNEEMHFFLFDCKKEGCTASETGDFLYEDFEHRITPSSIGYEISKINHHIYMLKDDMTPNEAIKDYSHSISSSRGKKIKWKENPEWLKIIGDTIDLQIKEVGYILYKAKKIKASENSIGSVRITYFKDKIVSIPVAPYKVPNVHPDGYIKPGHEPTHSKDRVLFICYAYGHETMKYPYNLSRSGCDTCNSFNKHPDPLAPGILYYGPLLDSPINDFKLGNTLERIGVKERSKNYGKFEWKEIHKPIGEGEKFEKKMKIKYEKYCTHNPMLKGNGSTECFDLIILPDLEKDIKEWLK